MKKAHSNRVIRPDERRLFDVLADTSRHRGRVIEVSGEPGSGKTRILADFTQSARDRNTTVLIGRCTEADATAPFRCLRQCAHRAAERIPRIRVREARRPPRILQRWGARRLEALRRTAHFPAGLAGGRGRGDRARRLPLGRLPFSAADRRPDHALSGHATDRDRPPAPADAAGTVPIADPRT
ncbi:ATP-binding protein [Saccharopolyspora hirsuta]|uniref:ATP-binding protein n=1 Tax=Saccharopolyspora hirsuta TaxID=1837 RepID=A0A5M7C005_SACHI|nr:ATP-binding protein [Saccharopolyspora hirsuta]